jgi:hypothetical protein
MVDEMSTAELGGLLGAELVVVGSYTAEADGWSNELIARIDARIVDLETGEIVGIGRVTYVAAENAGADDTSRQQEM